MLKNISLSQLTSHLLMIRPVAFGFNTETALNNHFQQNCGNMDPAQTQRSAISEFDALATKLEYAGVDITIVNDTVSPSTPDSIFPNNWVSFHKGGTVVLYPMFAKNRRAERRIDILETLQNKGTVINRIIDLTDPESDNRYLEGTGSMVLDRDKRMAYACISERTDQKILENWAKAMGYTIVSFHADQLVKGKAKPIYHTNVMLSIGEDVSVICSDSISNSEEREKVLLSLKRNGKDVIEITQEQTSHFVGNMLQVKTRVGDRLMVMSTRAFNNLTSHQVKRIENTSRIIHSPLDTIETLGGGSARCMLAEIFC